MRGHLTLVGPNPEADNDDRHNREHPANVGVQNPGRSCYGDWVMRGWVWFTVLGLSACWAEPKPRPTAPPPGEQLARVQSIIAEHCLDCHGGDEATAAAGLRLDIPEGVYAQRPTGTVVVPGDPDNSLLFQRIITTDAGRMPPAPRPALSREQVEAVRLWIEGGAQWVGHWSLVSIQRPAVPEVQNTEAVVNPIDAFVLQELEKDNLQFSPPASPAQLLRRVSLDVTGLPPDEESITRFEDGFTEQSYASLVDELLASDAHAEHAARLWLDAARYADTHGFQLDLDRQQWPWRDWVIDAFRRNLPFDQFTIEQLAGDLLPEATDAQRLASAFNRNHSITVEGGVIDDEFRSIYVGDRAETTATVWMGVTLGCARCHDHKYDPISQRDYYQLFACFNRLDERGLGQNNSFGPTASLKSPLQPELPPENVMVMQDVPDIRATHILARGQYDSPLSPVDCAPPRVFEGTNPEGFDRLALARWLLAPEHPLTARVTVNRIWQAYFGRGLVATPDDFGLRGARPTHPQLLDWLAAELISSGWDLRHIERLIVSSGTYRQASSVRADLDDPDNLRLARGPGGRLQAEVIRDQALAVSGLLDRQLGGPPVYPYQPPGLWVDLLDRPEFTRPYVEGEGADLVRRSIYTFWKRSLPPPAMTVFGAPSRTRTTVSRPEAITALQALNQLNDPQYLEAAKHLAHRVLQDTTSNDPVQRAFRLLLVRAPSDEEQQILQTQLDSERQYYETHPAEATALLSVGRATPLTDEASAQWAAMTQVCRTLLNLDETIHKP